MRMPTTRLPVLMLAVICFCPFLSGCAVVAFAGGTALLVKAIRDEQGKNRASKQQRRFEEGPRFAQAERRKREEGKRRESESSKTLHRFASAAEGYELPKSGRVEERSHRQKARRRLERRAVSAAVSAAQRKYADGRRAKVGSGRSGRSPERITDTFSKGRGRRLAKVAKAEQRGRKLGQRVIHKRLTRRAVTKTAKKTLGFAIRKFPIATAGFFVYDWHKGGLEYAVKEATWPVSECFD